MPFAGLRPAVIVACLLLTVPAVAAPGGELTTLQQQFQKQHADYVSQLKSVRERCIELGLTALAEEIDQLQELPKPSELKSEPLPGEVQLNPPDGLTRDGRAVWNRLRDLRKRHAGDVYLFARRVLKAEFSGYAYNMVREALRHDPDHDMARRVLGFVRHEQRWVSALAADKLRKGYVWDDRFGWVLKSHLPHLEAGEELVDSRWMSAARAAEVRRDFRKAWEVQSDHYLIRTNVSLEKGVELGRALEEYYELFHEVFAGYFSTPDQMRKMFDGARSRSVASPKLVNYYRTREEYVDRLKDRFPQIAQTNGLYYTTDRTVHFFHDEAAENLATLYHESTHQLFYEAFDHERPIAEEGHFWIIEGIACYMESFRRNARGVSIGDPAYIRFENARQTLLVDRYSIPLQELSAMGAKEFQYHPQVGKNYSEASGLAAFFMHYGDGRYRDALVAHLTQLYSGNASIRARARSLDDLTGVRYEELDRQYAEFLREFVPVVSRGNSE